MRAAVDMSLTSGAPALPAETAVILAPLGLRERFSGPFGAPSLMALAVAGRKAEKTAVAVPAVGYPLLLLGAARKLSKPLRCRRGETSLKSAPGDCC